MLKYFIKATASKPGSGKVYWIDNKFEPSILFEDAKIFDDREEAEKIRNKLEKIRKYKEERFSFTIIKFYPNAV